MKILFGLLILFVCVPVVAQNYQAGGANRPNFGRSAALEQNESSAPGAKSKVQTRTFSNYSSRHGNWDQGVKTQGVQTQTAGTVQQPSAPQTFEEQVAQTDRAVDAKLTGQRPGAAGAAGAVAPTGKKAAAPQAEEEKPAATVPGAAQAAPGAAAAAGDPSAALAQVQNLMKSVENLQKMTGAMGGMAGTAAGNPGGANSASTQQMTDAMNTHSKDISAFMNAAGSSAGK